MEKTNPKLFGISYKALSEKISNFLDDPTFNDIPFLYFTDTRDPTSVENGVTSIGIPSGWLFYWWNTDTNDIFDFLGTDGSGNLLWQKQLTLTNVLSNLDIAGWEINTSRSYSQRSSAAFATDYTPSLTNDTQVIASISLTSTLITASEVDVLVNTGVGNIVIAKESLGGLVATSDKSISFIVPAGASYRLSQVSGTSSIIQIMELTQ